MNGMGDPKGTENTASAWRKFLFLPTCNDWTAEMNSEGRGSDRSAWAVGLAQSQPGLGSQAQEGLRGCGRGT